MRLITVYTALLVLLFSNSLRNADAYAATTMKEDNMQLVSASFLQGLTIPDRYTCEGMNISPELHWKNPPEKTGSFALIVDDPDAPGKTWTHWLLYNIPADMNNLPESLSPAEIKNRKILQGLNDFKKTGYGGPCPPYGHGPHRYFFKLYALDDMLNLANGITKDELEQMLKGHILARAELIGRFER